MDESKELKQKLLNMLKWFHAFCKEHGLRYYALGGTMLGAVRHKGFIPWDDDVDLGMPRGDYEKLIDLTRDLKGKYLLESPKQGKKDFVYAYCKLYDTSTTLIENTRYKTKRGVYLDIFPLDGIGNTIEESYSNFKKIDRKLNFISAKVCAFNKNRKFYKNCAILVGRCIPEFIFGWRKEIKKVNELCASRSFDDYKFAGNLLGNWHYKEIVPQDCFGEPDELDFEDMKICVPHDYDKYLTNVYGDYMTPPPAEKQKSHHDYIELSLNKSYLGE